VPNSCLMVWRQKNMHSCDIFMSSLVTVLLQCGLYLLTFCIGGGNVTAFSDWLLIVHHKVSSFYLASTCHLWIFFVYIADPFFFQALNFLVENFGLLNDLFPLPLILDAGYPVFDLHLADVLCDVILPSVLGSSLWSFG